MVTVAEGTAPAFGHVSPGPAASGRPMQNTTRHLCAAVYLNRAVCALVIDEYLRDEHRAVVPSFGFDLDPVIRHALRARRLRISRDVLLALAWTLLLALAPGIAVSVGWALVSPAIAARIRWRSLAWPWRVVTAGALTLPFVYALLAPVLTTAAMTSSDAEEPVHWNIQRLWTVFQVQHPLATLALAFLCFALIYFGHLALLFWTLSRELAPGAHGPGPRVFSPRVEVLLERIRAAQLGNVTLYSGDNPFVGAGPVWSGLTRAWSIVLELDRPGGGPLDGESGGDPLSMESPGRPDPMTMHRRVQESVRAMRDEWPPSPDGTPPDRGSWLPPNERVTGLNTGWHVVAPGLCEQWERPVGASDPRPFRGHPLIDGAARLPYSLAGDEAVDALVRHPQGAVRCFQRITVGAQSQPVLRRDGGPLAPAADRDQTLTTFVYLAVEGRMLYGQFVATVLPPVRSEFRVVDLLSAWSVPVLLGQAVRVGWRGFAEAVLLPVPRTVAAAWGMAGGALAAASGGDPTARTVRDYGSRLSVRELVADTDVDDFLQATDVDKYAKLIERRVNEALLDYLGTECGVDVSAFREQAGTLLNQGVIMTGGRVDGQISVAGSGSRVRQAQGVNP
ncbi:hypothetical protein [Actinomadura harenae]|uniref:Uncharacterized protein n=1 Tax=Actinomadura harenae TaxID=2483351 RepID=A0A3M2L6P1_9ACTN|nr:hypothetical protein [Actinomadura harenae]RMI31585.1 hypothetical protein EBO15_42475 [Actinomadura harenae]